VICSRFTAQFFAGSSEKTKQEIVLLDGGGKKAGKFILKGGGVSQGREERVQTGINELLLDGRNVG